MKLVLTPMEARVIGCLIEKQITTPDQYPLSLNALTNACNQKSNRDPMMDVDEATVQRTLDDLGKKHLILERSGFGSRVQKYQHRFCNTEFGPLKRWAYRESRRPGSRGRRATKGPSSRVRRPSRICSACPPSAIGAMRLARVRSSPGVCGPRTSSSQTMASSCGDSFSVPNSVLQKRC